MFYINFYYLFSAYLVTKLSNNQEIILYEGYMYQKYLGRAYRSYFSCVGDGCNGQIVLNELKGGSIVVKLNHIAHCKPNMFNESLIK